MGQNNNTKEHGDPQGQQGGQVKISSEERKRESGYLNTGKEQDETARASSKTSHKANDDSGHSENATPQTQTDADRKGNATVAELPGGNKSERTGKARQPKNDR